MGVDGSASLYYQSDHSAIALGGLPKHCNYCITCQSPPSLALAVVSKSHLVVSYPHL